MSPDAIDDGVWAFPLSTETQVQQRGMSLRDYFAAKALQALIIRGVTNQPDQIAERAYEIADAMIAARKD